VDVANFTFLKIGLRPPGAYAQEMLLYRGQVVEIAKIFGSRAQLKLHHLIADLLCKGGAGGRIALRVVMMGAIPTLCRRGEDVGLPSLAMPSDKRAIRPSNYETCAITLLAAPIRAAA
jgi:hypothetical protein